MVDLKLLKETIDVFGGNVDRWPSERINVLRPALESDEGAALLREAAAVDAVLDAATGETDRLGGHDDLVNRIMMATAETGKASMPVETRRSVPERSASASAGVRRRTREWIAGGLMAASLAIGVFAGVNGFGATVSTQGVAFVQASNTETADDMLFADLTFESEPEFEDDV